MLPEDLMREVRRLEIRTRRRVDDVLVGRYHSAFKGEGIEFAEVREYEPGDDVRSIDWNVTARSGRTFVKRFTEERQLTVLLAVDVSASGVFGTAMRTKARLAAEAASVLAMTATRTNDRVGLMLFGEDVELYLPARKGRTHLRRVLRELLNAEPRGRGTGLGEALTVLGRVLHRHAVVFVVSDFMLEDGAEVAWDTPMRVLSRRHDVIAVRVSDPRERDVPPIGLVEMTDPEQGTRTVFDASSRRARRRLREIADAERASVDGVLSRCGVDVIDLSTDRAFVPDLARYLRARQRRH